MQFIKIVLVQETLFYETFQKFVLHEFQNIPIIYDIFWATFGGRGVYKSLSRSNKYYPLLKREKGAFLDASVLERGRGWGTRYSDDWMMHNPVMFQANS